MSIAQKLANVALEIPQPDKSGENDFDGYKYHTRNDLVDAIRQTLFEHGVAVFPSTTLVDHKNAPKTKGGSPQFRANVHVELTFVDGETGDARTVSWDGESVMTGDKATASAGTQAIRFALLNTFLISDDMIEEEHQRRNPESRNVHRETSDSTGFDQPLEAIKGRLKGLDFSQPQTKEFLAYLARREEANTPREITEAALQKWADRLVNGPDEKVREKVMDKLD
jgi:hypothetical protein